MRKLPREKGIKVLMIKHERLHQFWTCILERGGRKVGGGKYRRDRKREKLNEEKNNKKNKITVSITRTNARSRC